MPCSCDESLMRINVGDRRLRESGLLLLIGSCMRSRYPEIVEEFRQRDGGQAVLDVCLEEMHVNHAGFKIASIIRYSGIRRVTALTVDGSPHCVQLHYVIEDIKRHFTTDVETAHYVVERGEVFEISPAAVKRSRHLSKIQHMLDR
ncbi:MAG: 4Fe-4S ferredoxin [Candidatus Thorarchaeota archaeon]